MEIKFENSRTIEDIYKYENIILFGAGNTSKTVIDFFGKEKISALFDNDDKKWGRVVNNIIIRNPEQLKSFMKQNTCIVISSAAFQYEIAKGIIDKFDIDKERIFSFTNSYCEKYIYDIDKIKRNMENIKNCLEILSDEESKEYIERTIMTRITRNPLYLIENKNIKKNYEYGDIVKPRKNDVILDCGAYTGDTAKLFYDKLNGKCAIYAVEPFLESYLKMKDRFKDGYSNEKFKFFNYAVSNEQRIDIVRCSKDAAYVCANLNSKNGEILNEVKVETIDNLFVNSDKIDFIKMDIEGEEVNALEGGRETIIKFKPEMMISAYHLVEHIWEIPEVIKSFGLNIEIYAGHQPKVPFEIEYYVKFCF